MRSSHGPRSSLLYAALPAAALVSILAACGSDDAGTRSAFGGGGENAGVNAGEAQEPVANELAADAAAPPRDAYRGNPLCHLNENTCDPDDDGSKVNASYAEPCAMPPNPEAGTVSQPKGCRISGTGAIPACLEANPAGSDGAKCASGAECAPGFDCVVSGDAAYCRRYCCGGSCGTHRSQNGAETFCDVQTLQGSTTKAPVCMPIKTCKLFTAGECAETETCSVVTDDGTTGCVANGDAKVGEPCDTEHCSAGLTCLGQAGSRKCLQLCRSKTGPTCPANQFCKTATIFSDPAIGVCAPTQ